MVTKSNNNIIMATINLLPLTTSPNQDISPIKNINKFPVGKTRRKLSLDVKADNSRVKGRIALKNVNKLFHEASFRDEIDPANHRNTIFHNMCTAVLAEGYHEAFTELFTLVQKQREEHKLAGPAAILLSPLIDDDNDKLMYLVKRLKEAETGRRKEELDIVYMCQKDLALHFEGTDDRWLADHFHLCCLETGRSIAGDNRRKEGEAHLHVGLAYENRGEFEGSVKHLLEFYNLTRLNKWHTDSGERLHPIACEHLRRVYTKMAEKQPLLADSIEYLIKAHELAKESGDTYQEGVANYRLGCAYEKTEDYSKAILSHKGYLERCRYHGDQVGVSKAYEAISRCHEKNGDIESAVKFLELYVGIAEGIEAKETVAKAYCAAGVMFNELCDYKKAVDYFSKCYKTCKSLDDKKAMESARVHYGIAQTHHKLSLFNGKIGMTSDNGIRQLIDWKGKRKLSKSAARSDDVNRETKIDSSHIKQTDSGITKKDDNNNES